MSREAQVAKEVEEKLVLYSPLQVAGMLRVTTWTLWHWRKLRRGPPFLVLEGGRIRYIHRDLIDYLHGRLMWTGSKLAGKAKQRHPSPAAPAVALPRTSATAQPLL